MKFDLQEIPAKLKAYGPRVGDVYRMKGGRKGGGYWIIVGMTERFCICLGIDMEGNIVSCTNYYDDVMDARQRVGSVNNLSDLTFQINWE